MLRQQKSPSFSVLKQEFYDNITEFAWIWVETSK